MATTSLSAISFKVDLVQLETAIGIVEAQAGTINDNCTAIQADLRSAEAAWSSPAGQGLPPIVQACTSQMNNLTSLCDEMIVRMRTAYQNYLNTEQVNYGNLDRTVASSGGSDTRIDTGRLRRTAIVPGSGQIEDRPEAHEAMVLRERPMLNRVFPS